MIDQKSNNRLLANQPCSFLAEEALIKKSIISQKAVIICGPTASGKTAYAHEFAKQHAGEIVNCDSMQVYQQIPIITASPSNELILELPYHLYNFKDVSEEFSVAEYCIVAAQKIREISSRGNLPVIVGGTGMYINALIDGLNQIPNISLEIRAYVRNLHLKLGNEKFHAELASLDPIAGLRLNIGDTHRTIRAYEVIKQTGKSIYEFQAAEKVKSLPEYEFEIILLRPDRNFLYENCNKRLAYMFQNGAIEEIKNIINDNHHLGFTASKALGLSQIKDFLAGKISYEQALELAANKTRQYAKRQTTWFKHQISPHKLVTL